jgi:hypothetical protein
LDWLSRRREDRRSAAHCLAPPTGAGSVWLWHPRRLFGPAAGCVFFTTVNQVLVRLWARHLDRR